MSQSIESGFHTPEENLVEAKDIRTELLLQRHRFAVLGMKLEEYIAKAPYPTMEEFGEQNDISSLPDSVIKEFDQIIKFYEQQKQKVGWVAAKLEEELEMDFSKPEEAGEKFFIKVTGQKPKGKVTLGKTENYFLIFFEKDIDYIKISRSDRKNVTVINGEIYAPSGGRCDRGAYSTIELALTPPEDIGAVSAPTLLINQGHSDQESINVTIKHERQHVINHFFVEKKEKNNAIKDEVLAYIRDGRGAEIETILQEKLYEHLFASMTPTEKERQIQLLQRIVDALTTLFQTFEKTSLAPNIRGLVTYHLYDVPLEKFPRRLQLIEQFLKDRMSIFLEEKIIEQSKPFIQAETNQTETTPLITAYKECVQAYQTAAEAVLNSVTNEKSALDEDYLEKRKRFLELAEAELDAADENFEPTFLRIRLRDVVEFYKNKEITDKNKAGQPLSKKDLRHFYHLDATGSYRRSFVDAEKTRRDLAEATGLSEDRIALEGEVIQDETEFYYGDLYLEDEITSPENLKLPKFMRGNLSLPNLTSTEGLKLPEEISGNLDLSGITSAVGLKLPRVVTGFLNLSEITSPDGLELPERVQHVGLFKLKTIKNLKLPKKINRIVLMDLDPVEKEDFRKRYPEIEIT